MKKILKFLRKDDVDTFMFGTEATRIEGRPSNINNLKHL